MAAAIIHHWHVGQVVDLVHGSARAERIIARVWPNGDAELDDGERFLSDGTAKNLAMFEPGRIEPKGDA
jgi:hypothetical protein